MLKHTLAGLAAVVLTCAAPVVAKAATPPSAVVAQDGELEARRALVRRYFEVAQFDKVMNTMMEAMATPMVANMRLPQDKVPVVREAFLVAVGNVMPQMMDAYVDQYAGAFTRPELEDLVAFYESPTGRSIMTKTVALTRDAGVMLERFQPIFDAEIRRQVCARIECPEERIPVVVVAP